MPRSVPVALALLALVTMLAAALAFGPGAAAQVPGDGRPDLTVTIQQSGVIVISPEGTSTVTFTVTTRNDGVAPAGESRTRLELVPTPPDGGNPIDIEIPALPPGSPPHETRVPVPLRAGEVQVIARADAGGDVDEADEENNLSHPSRVFTIGPDLEVQELRVRGGGATAEDSTANSAENGTGVAASTTRFYLSEDDTLDGGDIPVGSRAVPALDAQRASAGRTPLTLPPGLTEGTYHVIAVADGDGVQSESNEANNRRSRSAQFRPDLIISSLTVPRKTVAGATISVSDTTTNRGTARASASSTTALYFSRDLDLDRGDIFLGSRAIPPLDARASSVAQTTVVIPDNTPPGCYFIIAAADIDNAVDERTEANTARARPIQIRPASGAKLACAHRDFNGDRQSDVLWRHASGDLTFWLMGTMSLSSAAIDAGPPPVGTIAGVDDFDGDGKADILWRDAAGGLLTIWFMDDTGVSGSATIPDGPALDWTIQGIADFNGDGKADILWRHAFGLLAIWLMDGATISSSAVIPDGPSLDWTIQGIADFDGDGRADILWRHAFGLVAIWLMDGPTIRLSATIPGGPSLDWTIQGIGDFDGSGRADIVWRHASGLVAIWLMDGTSISSSATPASLSLDWTVHGIGDFDEDGTADILWRDASGRLVIWLMDGTAIGRSAPMSDSPSLDLSLDWSVHGVGDFDGDGRADILARHASGLIARWIVDSKGISSATIPDGPSLDWTIQGTGDFNGDGTADILWRDASGVLVIWLMEGTTILGSAVISGGPTVDWTLHGIGDFDGDGRADILARHASGLVAIWFMDGSTVIRSATIPNSPSLDWTIQGIGDFNGDSRADILWRGPSGLLEIWLMDGATITGSAAIPDGPSLDWTIQGIGDFNRDHKADILWRHAFGLVAIWLMDGTAIAGGATIADGPSLDWTIQGIGDFNGDVNADILWRHAFGLVAIWYMDGTTFDEARVVGSVGLDWTLE